MASETLVNRRWVTDTAPVCNEKRTNTADFIAQLNDSRRKRTPSLLVLALQRVSESSRFARGARQVAGCQSEWAGASVLPNSLAVNNSWVRAIAGRFRCHSLRGRAVLGHRSTRVRATPEPGN